MTTTLRLDDALDIILARQETPRLAGSLNACADAWACASDDARVLAEAARAGDVLTYDDMEALDEQTIHEFRRQLDDRGLTLVDDGDGLTVAATDPDEDDDDEDGE